MQWIAVFSNYITVTICYVRAVVYLVCEDVVLGYGWVSVFILLSVVKRSSKS